MNNYFCRAWLLLLFFVSISFGEIVLVKASGNALNKELARAQRRDTLLLTPGTYIGRFIIPPGVTLLSDSLHQAHFKANGRDRVLILTHNATVSGLQVTGGQVGIYSGGSGNKIENSLIHHNQQSGILAVGYGISIIDNIIYRNGGSGIQLWGISESAHLISNNTITHNLGHGIAIGGESSISFINNIVSYNSRLTISADPTVIIKQEYNVYYYNSELNMSLPEKNFSFNPMFFAPNKDLYYLKEDSHCLKNGRDGEDIGSRVYSNQK